MGTGTDVPRTRRHLLLGGLGGIAALLANGLGRPQAANAGVDGDVILGAVNTAATTTKVRNPTTTEAALWGAGASGAGVFGSSLGSDGIQGRSATGSGVVGFSTSGAGVHGWSTRGTGMRAQSDSGISLYTFSVDGLPVWADTPDGKAAIYAVNENVRRTYPAVLGVTPRGGPGVMGVWGNESFPARPGVIGPAQTAVYGVIVRGDSPPVPGGTGVHGSSDEGRGVYGQSVDGKGVVGEATAPMGITYGIHGKVVSPDGRAVHGEAAKGTGVRGSTDSGTGGAFYASSGYALRTSGRLRLEKASGVATIAAGSTGVTVAPGLDVTSASFVLLTPKADLGGRRLWYTTNTTSNTITIKLSSAAAASVRIGWLLLG